VTGPVGKVKGKGEAMPVRIYTGPECSIRLRFLYFLTISNKAFKVVSPNHWPL
jgi:hypothetical protein